MPLYREIHALISPPFAVTLRWRIHPSKGLLFVYAIVSPPPPQNYDPIDRWIRPLIKNISNAHPTSPSLWPNSTQTVPMLSP